MPGNNRNHGHWSMVPSLNYIENILIYNFEIQCERHFCRRRPKNISKFFIFPDIDAPLYVVKTSLSPYNSHLPLSIFYQTDQYFKKTVSKIEQIHSNNIQSREYYRLTKKALKAQKSILSSIFYLLTQVREVNPYSRRYRLWIPGGEHEPSTNYYSEYVLFAAQTLLNRVSLYKLEEYTVELHSKALALYNSLDNLIQAIYHRMKFSMLPPYNDLKSYLCDFDKLWITFEKRLYICYHNVYRISRIINDPVLEFQNFMVRTLVHSVKKNYFTLDMINEYDPSLMIALPRLTFVYVIYHLSNPFFFSNFPWFSNERLVEIDKLLQIFNLLNRNSIEKLELYLIHGISNVHDSYMDITNNEINPTMVQENIAGNNNNLIFGQNSDVLTSRRGYSFIENYDQNPPIQNDTSFAIMSPSVSELNHGLGNISFLSSTSAAPVISRSKKNKKKTVVINQDCNTTSFIDYQQNDSSIFKRKLETVDEIGSPKEEDWVYHNGNEDSRYFSTAEELEEEEEELIGDILVRKVFKSICSIVDEFQSSGISRRFNRVMSNVFEIGIKKIEYLQNQEMVGNDSRRRRRNC